MKKLLILIPGIIILIFLAYFSYMNSYVKYVPIVVKDYSDWEYIYAPNLEIDVNNLKLILNFYEQKFKIINGKLYIKRKLALDKEMIYNYTDKVRSPMFIEYVKQQMNK